MILGRIHQQQGLVRRSSSEAGIALGPLLFIVAILAIIGAVIAAGSGAFNANTGTERANSNAQVILDYADQLRLAVQKVYLENGCGDTQFQFQVNNPNAPSDGSCNIFDPRGGDILNRNFTNLPDLFNMAMATNNSNWAGTFGYFGQGFSSGIIGVGNYRSNTALLIYLMDVNLNTCTSINTLLKFNAANNYAPPAVGWYVFSSSGQGYFSGTYYYNGPYDIGFSNGATQGCVYINMSGYYNYAYVGVLLAR